jgi:death on curing protein
VLIAHELVVSLFGGRRGILNQASIESAIGRPYSGYHRSIARKAAALVQSLAQNHGFVDGNKRTALSAMSILLYRSGYMLHAGSEDQLNDEAEAMVLAVANHRMEFDAIVVWLRERLAKRVG